MRHGCSSAILAVAILAGCARDRWPEPPPVDAAEYQKQHESWQAEERAGLSQVLPISGIWPLADGDTLFGAERTLPIVLPAAHFTARAGTFRRAGDAVTVIPATPSSLTLDDGTTLDTPKDVDAVNGGPIRLQVVDAGDDRRWAMAVDTAHPAIANPPAIESYPLDPRWRVAARFDAFDRPKPVRVPDVRGGFMEFTAIGELRFRFDNQEMRLTAFGDGESPEFFVMFKDPTNQSTTYNGYRIVAPPVVKDGDWTVLDFNFAVNPPCAYSKYTTCPLPPPENRLPVAIEAGLKRLPGANGY
jgi:uncharacterized protein (DUF1684 family)